MNQKPEQEICLKCGMCCDGTLFDYAEVGPREKDLLPVEIRKNYIKEGEKERFKLPCTYFRNRCIIYEKTRARICYSFRCQLLRKYAENKITQSDAMMIIENARNLKLEIISCFRTIFRNHDITFYRQLFEFLKKYPGNKTLTGTEDKSLDLFFAKCNILEVLLTRYFRAGMKFQEMSESLENKMVENGKILSQ